MRVGAAIALTIVLPAGNINAAQSLGQAILGPIVGPVSPALAGALGQVALTTAFNGGDVEGALKTTARGLIASGAGAEVGEGLTNAGTSEVIGRVGSSATAALINGKDVEKAVGESLLRNAPDLVQNAPPKGNTMTAPFESDFGVPNEVQTDTTDYSQFDAFNEYPASTGDFQPLTNNLQPLTTPEILVAQSLDPGTGAGMVFPDIATPASLDDTRVTVGPFDPKHVEVKPAPQSSDPYGNTFRDVAVGVSTAATAALALVKLYDATQGVNTQARVTQTTPQGRATVVALDSGIVQTRNPDGTVTNKRPPVGVAQTTVGGNIVVNNGDGTYTSIAPNGAKSVYAYDPTQSSDTFGDKLKAIPPALWFGGIGLLIAALRS